MSVSFSSEVVVRKKSVEELEEANKSLKVLVPPALIKQTFSCYTGFQAPVDYAIKRPIGFIGPLEHEILPDSLCRRVIWLAYLLLPKTEIEEYMHSIPGIEVIKRVAKPELMFIRSERYKKRVNCFDEVFKANPYYKAVVEGSQSYSRMCSLAFEKRSPKLLLSLMGYQEVSRASKGDLIVYFSRLKPSPINGLPSFVHSPKPTHYGTVVDIEDGTIMVESRFADSHIYRHKFDCIPYFFGSSCLFFSNKNRPVREDVEYKSTEPDAL